MLGWLRNAVSSIRERREARRLEAERRVAQYAAEQLKGQEERQRKAKDFRNWLDSLEHRNEAWRIERVAAQEIARKDAEIARQREIEEKAEDLRRWYNPFRVGERFENRKGTFTVISLSDDRIHIRWDTGEELTDSVASQARIFRNMRREQHKTQAQYASSREAIKCARCGAYVYFDNATYYDGKPYGSTCIKYVRRF